MHVFPQQHVVWCYMTGATGVLRPHIARALTITPDHSLSTPLLQWQLELR